MRTLLLLVLMIICVSCSHQDDSTPAPIKEQVTITWKAETQDYHELQGTIKVDVYTHDGKQYGTTSIHNNVYLVLEKGDYVTFDITPKVIDQSQNEAGITVSYVVSTTKGVICEGFTNGTGFLIK